MPKYDYRCLKCDHRWEQYSTIDGRRDLVCPECSGEVDIVIPRDLPVLYKAQGFAHQELAKDKLDMLAKEATEEGFLSTTEMEVSVEQAIARAEKKGIDPARLVGKETLETGKVPSLEEAFENVM